jgi:predicted ester cyclase
MEGKMETSVTNTPAASCTSNSEVVARLWREAFNEGNLDALPELVRADFKNFDAITDGPEFLKSLITAQRRAFPDMHFTPLQVLVDADWVVTRARWTGTFLAPFSFIGFDGIDPTGRRFDVEHVHAFRFVDGKIAEHWAVRDDRTMHNQLLGNVL